MPLITINGITIDPDQDGPQLNALAPAGPPGYLLVQTTGPLTKAQRAALASAGAPALEYVPTDTYVCNAEGAELGALTALPFVHAVLPYTERVKIAPELHAGAPANGVRAIALTGVAAAPDSTPAVVDVVLHRDADPAAARAAIAAATGRAVEDLPLAGGKLRTTLLPTQLGAVARVREVRHVELVHDKKLWNDVARALLGATSAQAHQTLEGEGQIVAVCDTGFDLGSTTNTHPAFTDRVLKLYALGRPGDASDRHGHGTHVCGSVLGDHVSPLLGRIAGTAPKATLIVQAVVDAAERFAGLPEDLGALFAPPYADGARVHSNSWGDRQNRYTEEAREVDDFVWANRDAVILFAAGNDGRDSDGDGAVDRRSVGSPGTAKNAITIGASENRRPGFAIVDGDRRYSTYGTAWPTLFPRAPVANDELANNPSGLAAFSSRGPTADGRIKPDLVAPGTGILSTRSRVPGVGDGWAASADPLYFFDGGTSMATPLAAGCAAVVREHLQHTGLAQPSAALVKAMLINGADPLPGQYTPSELGAVPSPHQGFGRINLAATVGSVNGSAVVGRWDEAQALDTGDEQQFTIQLPAHATAVKVTLVWTDPPGETLQNDLDLIVEVSGRRGYGNAAPGSDVADRTNNVEQVTLSTLPASQVVVTVRAHRIAVEAQTFALVVRALS